MGGSDAEFPLLSALGLYVADTRGDGNCLFHALSDQLYGHQNEHSAIRARVIDYMREHASYYKQFVDVHPGGGIRRNPKRKNAGAYSSPANYVPPSEADIERVFEMHLQTMARGGTYGDNMEITAFSGAFETDVKIYQRDFAYMVTDNPEESSRPVAHIAYHMWEHYSSIRNIDGPHDGPPDVVERRLTWEEEQQQQTTLAETSYVLPWMYKVVQSSLPWMVDESTIKRAIEAARGDINLAVSNMLEESGSASSQHESSSVERDHDSDDDMHDGPNKKQDRRMSRASKAQRPRSMESKNALAHLATYDGSQESIGSSESEASSAPESSQQNSFTHSSPLEEFKAGIQSPDSASASRSESPVKPTIKLKLHGPKAPERIGKSQQRQPGPRVTARDRKELKKQAQKAARKEREKASARGVARSQSPSAAGLALRQKGMTDTPPTDVLRTLYI